MNQTDAISRSAVLAVGNVRKVVEYDEAGYDMTYDAVPVEAIEALPALDVAPVVHARWIGGKYYNDVYGYEKTCTSCQKEYVVGFDYLYCPYCGAKMDGGMKDEC